MTVADVVAHTGLPAAEATLAKTRTGSEPLVWKDTNARLDTFSAQIASHGWKVQHGGRFHHVMGATDKGAAVTACLQQMGPHPVFSVGLGDSATDIPMLRAVDNPVLIPKRRAPTDPSEPAESHGGASPGTRGVALSVEQIVFSSSET